MIPSEEYQNLIISNWNLTQIQHKPEAAVDKANADHVQNGLNFGWMNRICVMKQHSVSDK